MSEDQPSPQASPSLEQLAEVVASPSLEQLAEVVHRLDAGFAKVTEDLLSLRTEFAAHLWALPSRVSRAPAAEAPARGAPAGGAAGPAEELKDLVEDVVDRLQRLEMLLFRLPEPDFAKLDKAIAQLSWRVSPANSPRLLELENQLKLERQRASGQLPPLLEDPQAADVGLLPTIHEGTSEDQQHAAPQPQAECHTLTSSEESEDLEEYGVFDYDSTYNAAQQQSATSEEVTSDEASAEQDDDATDPSAAAEEEESEEPEDAEEEDAERDGEPLEEDGIWAEGDEKLGELSHEANLKEVEDVISQRMPDKKELLKAPSAESATESHSGRDRKLLAFFHVATGDNQEPPEDSDAPRRRWRAGQAGEDPDAPETTSSGGAEGSDAAGSRGTRRASGGNFSSLVGRPLTIRLTRRRP